VKNVIPNECEESLRSLPEFTLSKHEGLGTRISRYPFAMLRASAHRNDNNI